jgi:hypothetical protein
MISTA